MKKILIGGYYGANNIGDEAILDSMLGGLRSLRNDLSFIVTSWKPEETSRQFNVDAIYWKDINALLDAGTQADMIILGGGGLFHDYWGFAPDTYLRRDFWDISAFGSLPLLAKLLEIPCMIYAVGVGPFQSELARQHTRLAFERCQVATLRDNESLEVLKQTGFKAGDKPGFTLEVLPDPVFSMTISREDEVEVARFLRERQIDEDAQLVCVVLRFWDLSAPLLDWLPYIAEGLNRFLAENSSAQVVLLPFQVLDATPHTNDAVVLKKLYEFMAESWRIHLIEEPVTPRFAQALIKRSSVVLGMRLHSLIMGINVGTPVVALSYAPKVLSVMKRAGLDEFCNATLTPNPEKLAAQLQKAWEKRDTLRRTLQPMQAQWNIEAQKHARLASELLEQSHRKPLQFGQQFALEQLRLLNQVDEARDRQDKEILALQSRLTELESLKVRLNEIESTNFWKLARLYYHLMENTPVRYPYRFAVTLKRQGLRMAFLKTLDVLRTHSQTKNYSNYTIVDQQMDAPTVVSKVQVELNARKLKGVFVVTSAFVFDELYNQRVINLSKYLAGNGWGVIYVAWSETRGASPRMGQEVFKNILEIPSAMFLKGYETLQYIQASPRYFVIEFPHPEFMAAALRLRRYGYKVVYEIIDDWEEFQKVGQAIWFTKAIERALVVNANYLTAVSRPLVEKFAFMRKDIHLIPNGFDPSLLGKRYQNVARRNFKRQEVHLGYFGHLTDSWFDWDLLLEMLDIAKERGLDVHVDLIGYGEPHLEDRLANYRDRVFLHGKIAPAELYKFVRDWDIAMIPFKAGRLSEAVDPIKIYEYLYFGLPVIVTGIAHLKDLPGVSVATDADQFVETIDQLRTRKENPKRSPVLREFTWKRRFSKLLNILESKEWMSL